MYAFLKVQGRCYSHWGRTFVFVIEIDMSILYHINGNPSPGSSEMHTEYLYIYIYVTVMVKVILFPSITDMDYINFLDIHLVSIMFLSQDKCFIHLIA